MIDYGELHAPTCVPRTRARVEPQEESGMVALAPPVLRLLPHALLWTLMLHAIGRTIAAPMARTAPASVPRVLQVHHVGDQAAAAAAGAVQLSPLFPLPRSSTLHPTATELIVSKNVSVVLDKSLYGAELTDTALVSGILSRYQQLLRSKVSWSGAEGSPSRAAELGTHTPVLTVVAGKITGSGDAATELGPETDESYSIAVT
jgi:hypothetical protein